jgi:hypothetical protein
MWEDIIKVDINAVGLDGTRAEFVWLRILLGRVI